MKLIIAEFTGSQIKVPVISKWKERKRKANYGSNYGVSVLINYDIWVFFFTVTDFQQSTLRFMPYIVLTASILNYS
ncbi:hypothetical protein RhiirC2_35016 [Rhizophagus irregularis]|uniref:Uncharacterized protein n=1 Tax=Rhizophagus irregularis TaxID=588596 RepID=A0A2N1MXN5_9GLOM|nr:hypothetical protein RhiirC2_35016 [Rhizophagus irregularis]